MKRFMLTYLTVMLGGAVFCSPSAFADGTTSSDTISEITFAQQGQVKVDLTSVTENPDSCSNNDVYIVDSSVVGHFELLSSALMTAKVAGISVKLYISGCVSGRPSVRAVIFD